MWIIQWMMAEFLLVSVSWYCARWLTEQNRAIDDVTSNTCTFPAMTGANWLQILWRNIKSTLSWMDKSYKSLFPQNGKIYGCSIFRLSVSLNTVVLLRLSLSAPSRSSSPLHPLFKPSSALPCSSDLPPPAPPPSLFLPLRRSHHSR